MHTHQLLRGTEFTIAACTALAILSGCGGASTPSNNSAPSNSAPSNSAPSNSATAEKSGTFYGPSQELGNGTVKTYTTLDNEGNPTEVGLRLTPTALDGLPETNTGPSQMLMLAFPDEAAATAFDHVMLNWNPQGHDPVALFGKPHFDLHFDMVDMATIQGINPDDSDYAAKAEHAPEAKYVPQDYAVPPGPPVAAQAVPGMGVHLVDSSDTSLVPGAYNFQQIIINGTWDGRYTFTEPMITREWLLTQPNLEQALKQPQAYQKTGYYPTTYAVHVDQQSKEYVISLAGLTMRNAS
jgi:Domain of unknown function (DUF5602)